MDIFLVLERHGCTGRQVYTCVLYISETENLYYNLNFLRV